MIRVYFIVKPKKGFTCDDVQKYYDEVHTKLPGGAFVPTPESRFSSEILDGQIVHSGTAPVDISKTEPYWRVTEYEFKDLETMKKAFASEKGQIVAKDEGFNRICDILRIITKEY